MTQALILTTRLMAPRGTKMGAAPILYMPEDFTLGPLQTMAKPSQFLRLRHRFWRRMMPGSTALRRPWHAAMRQMAEAGQIEIWAGNCAQDQVKLLALVDLAINLGKQPEQIRFRQFATVHT